jgi:hypothetical protein
MVVELALTIIIIIVIFTEFIKYILVKYFSNGEPMQDGFKKYNINNPTDITENTLFKRDINPGYTLRYW